MDKFANFHSKVTFFDTIEVDGEVYEIPFDQQMRIRSREEMVKVLELALKFYKDFSDDDISNYNYKKDQEDQEWMQKKPISRGNKGYIYVVKHQGLYKIGRSKNYSSRVKNIRTYINAEFIFAFPVKDMHTTESELHEIFAEKREYGEWFRLDESDLKYISDCEKLITKL